ncbi:MAG: ATP-binding protein [Bacteroidota bacterium]
MFTENIKKYFLPALLLIALIITLVKPESDNINSIARKIQGHLNDRETFFFNTVKEEAFATGLRKVGKDAFVVKAMEQKGIHLYCYHKDLLTLWSANSVLPISSPSLFENGAGLVKLKNGWYQSLKWEDTSSKTIILGLLPVKYAYPFENKFLKSDFALDLDIPGNIAFSDQKIEGSVPVKNLLGETLFSLHVTDKENEGDINILLVVSQFVLFLLLFYYLQRMAAFLSRTKGFVIGLLVLLVSMLLVRAVMLFFNLPDELNKLPLFDPKFYASSVITKSLGDLMLNILFLAWIVFFFYTHYARRERDAQPSLAMKLSGLVLVFAFTGLILWVYKTLVMDSVISFEIYNVLSLDLYSLLGFLCIALLMLIHFLLAKAVLVSLHESKHNTSIVLLFIVLCGLVFAAFGIGSEFYEAIFYTALWITAAVVLLYFQLNKDSSYSIRNILIYISVYSIISTLLIENLYERKERNSRKFFSGKLVSERDFIAEYMFSDIAKRVTADEFISNSFANPIISQKEVMDRINVLYLAGYFNRYNFQLHSFDANGNSIKSGDTLQFDSFRDLFVQDSTGNATLHYISDSALNYSYLSIIPFYSSNQYRGSLVLKLVPKVYYGQNVYPELLLGSNLTVSNNLNNYSYAVYQNDKLIAQYGDYPYSYYWNNDYKFTEADFEFVEEKVWELSIQRFANGKKVIVVVPREPVFEPVATFSYLFTFYFLVLGAVIFLVRIITAKEPRESLYGNLVISFRARINFSMLLMILISFIIIGFVTINFFSSQYDSFYTDRLLRKEKVVHASLEYFVQKHTLDTDHLDGELDLEIARLADINTIDINLFDRNGDLTISSQPIIYDKGIVSRKMNPDAYFELENNKTSQIIEHERIGLLDYLATYTPVRNNRGEAIAYLGIPYFERSKNVDDEVSSFLVALMNVYVFLLICAAILAYFISNSITRPLTIISEKLRILNLNKRNEPIAWDSKDEIGVLVSEYNKMINELEHSAQKLAKGERESAWREMAKQIAHEIKNPLTPMKLSIQYLQRAIDEGNPNIDRLARKVARTLEEQIENLSSIATAFSSFAKMPKAQNEIINLNELLKSISDLFTGEENSTVTFSTDAVLPLVFADKNQLVSVFNNLVKNAVQSIPENRKGFIDIHTKEEDGWVIVSVSDNGNGIPKDNYDKVFVPNFTTKSSGTGLGLAITKQIIDGAGGKIWFETAENVGTTFFVKLLKSKA